MKRFHQEAPFSLEQAGMQQGPFRHRTVQAGAHGRYGAPLSLDQQERRNDLLDRGLPFTWRSLVGGRTVILREHTCGRLEQMHIDSEGTLAVTRVLRDTRRTLN